ncbi:MAG: glycosyltransferase [Pseudomonadota bacterium]
MKIAILSITQNGISGGYKKYLNNIIPLISGSKEVDEVLCVFSNSIKKLFVDQKIAGVQYKSCKNLTLLNYFFNKELYKFLEEFDPDIIFLTAERPFKFKKVPVVVLFQDMRPFIKNGSDFSFINKIKLQLKKRISLMSFQMADKVITVSDSCKFYLKKELKINSDKINYIYYGVNPCEQSFKPTIVPDDWKNKFIFTAGSFGSYRGFEDLIKAFTLFDFNQLGIKGIVIASNLNDVEKKYKAYLDKLIAKHNLNSKVIWTDEISEPEMTWCYSNSQLFIMTSRVESIGMIALEALAHKCRIISARNFCLPEIFAEAALYYTPKDSEMLANVIKDAIAMTRVAKEEFVEKVEKQAMMFSWDKCLMETISNFNSILQTKTFK